ncbi:MAG TPA: universal stress protein [Gemmataceae bacterium]|jgi:nucleotide-binding universal stress UspA family protein|nr:universal stress protein [Gemmataceae bacterium]
MYRSILVPLDGSEFGEHALPLALGIARRAGATLQVAQVHVALAPMYAEAVLAFDNAPDNVVKQRERGYLERVVNRLATASSVPVDCALLEGPIAEAVNAQVKLTEVDLAVMTTHGRGPLARFWLGSVADELVRRLPIPLLLVRPQETKVDLSREPTFQHILIPLDGSPLAEQIIEPAAALGSLTGADYTLLRIIKPMVMGPYDPADSLPGHLDPSAVEQLQRLYRDEESEAGSYLERVAGRLRDRALKVQTRVVVHDQPAVAILEEVKAHRADLVALATHGRSGLPRLFLGSVADKLVRGTTVPVLLQRPAVK